MQKREVLLAGVAGAALAWAFSGRKSFKDKSVLITGGSKGLGLLLARRFAAEGARLTLVARDEAKLKRAGAGLRARYRADVLTVPCDVRDRDQVKEAVRQTLAHFGRIDVLVNNAGIIQAGPVAHMVEQDFENAMNVHFWGPLYTMLETVPHMQAQGGGANCQHRLHRWQGGGAAPRPLLGEQVRARRFVGRDAGGTRPRQHHRDDGVSLAYPHGFVPERATEGPARTRTRLVRRGRLRCRACR